MARKRITASGRVQGVSYRAYAADEAIRLGLKGWVRNRKNGDVEAVVEGNDASVQKFIEWCRRGSPAAKVSQVDAKDDADSEALGAFEVRPTV